MVRYRRPASREHIDLPALAWASVIYLEGRYGPPGRPLALDHFVTIALNTRVITRMKP